MKNNKNNNNNKKSKPKTAANPGQSQGKNKKVTGTKKLVVLADNTAKYARALANPVTGPLASIPNAPAQFTRKVRTFSKGTFDCKANGQAWIASCPEMGIANNQADVLTVDSTGVSNGWFQFGTAGNVLPFSSNAEYVTADVGPTENQFEYRVVSSSLRIRYIGTELNRSGQMVAVMDPSHNSLLNRTLSSLDGEETSRRFPVDKSWTTILYRPVHDSDFDFRNFIPVYTGVPADPDVYYMGFAIQSPAGTSTPYEWEKHTTYEVFGKNIRGMTPSHVDPTGFGAVHAVSQLSESLYPTKEQLPNVEKKFVTDTAQYVGANTTFSSHVSAEAADHIKKSADSAIGGISAAAGMGIAAGILSFLF